MGVVPKFAILQPLTCVGGCFVFEGVDGGLGLGLVGGEAWLADTGPATQSRRRSSAGGCSACFVPVGPGLDLILFIVQLGLLEEFLFADGGDEFLEVEWFEVGDVFEAVLAVGAEGWLEH